MSLMKHGGFSSCCMDSIIIRRRRMQKDMEQLDDFPISLHLVFSHIPLKSNDLNSIWTKHFKGISTE